MNATATIADSAFVGTSNYVYFIAILAFVLSSLVICFKDVLRLLVQFPVSMLEMSSYLLFGSIIYHASTFSKNFAHIVALPPALFISVTLFYTIARILKAASQNDDTSEAFKITIYNSLYFGINTLFYAMLAIYIDSVAMGYISIMCLMSLIGFNVGFGPGYIAVGYKNKNVIPSATFASLVVLLIGVYFKVADPVIQWNYINSEGNHSAMFLEFFMHVYFVPPMLWFGSFVYFISLLIMSSRGYVLTFDRDVAGVVYTQMQMVAIISGLTAIYFGNLYEIQQLYGIAGTIITIYFAEKIYEVSPEGSGKYLIFFGSLLILLANTYLRSYLLDNGYDQMIETYFNLYPGLK